MKLNPFSSESDTDEEPTRTADILNAPISIEHVNEVDAQEMHNLTESDRDLDELAELLQGWVEEYEYDKERERPQDLLPHGAAQEVSITTGQGTQGHALADWLVTQFTDNTLTVPKYVSDEELIFVAPEELWAAIAMDRGFNNREVGALRTLHNYYANDQELTSVTGQMSAMAISLPHPQLRHIASLSVLDDDQIDVAPSEYEATRRNQA